MLKLFAFCVLILGVCGNSHDELNGRIFGGQDAQLAQFPHMASLRAWYMESWYHFCGGSIVTEQWILTAGHCLTGVSADIVKVFLGTITTKGDGDIYDSALFITHEDFTTQPIRNDVGLVKLTKKITITVNVKPIRLSDKYVEGGLTVLASGFGRINENDQATTLQYLQQTTWTYDQCNNKLNTVNYTEKNVCALTSIGKGMCNGDSGSPLIGNNLQIGIASWVRKPCGGGNPDIYVRVADYLYWISLTVASN